MDDAKKPTRQRITKEQLEEARKRLAELASRKADPTDFTMQDAVTMLLDELVDAEEMGYTLEEALKALNGDELSITLATLKSCKRRALRERSATAPAQQRKESQKTEPSARAAKGPASKAGGNEPKAGDAKRDPKASAAPAKAASTAGSASFEIPDDE